MQEEYARLGRRVVVEPGEAGEHVPFAGVDSARERPAAGEGVAALHFFRLAGGKDERGGDQRVGRCAPDLVLRLGREHAEHQVMRQEVDEVPRARRAGARQQRAELDHGDEIELRAADAFRLMNTQQLRVVKVAQRLLGNAPQLFAARRALAQHRQQPLRPAPELSVRGRRFCTSQGSVLQSTSGRRAASRCTRRAFPGSRCDAARR